MAETDLTTDQLPTVALTGATGFVGKNFVTQLLQAGFKVKALTRRPQNSGYYADPKFANNSNLTWVSGDLNDTAALSELCKDTDCLYHIAALTKALSRQEFFDVNSDASLKLMQIAEENAVKRFIMLSSMAARMPALSHYGASKAAADLHLLHKNWSFDWTIVRPPAIYGPFEQEILTAIKLYHGKKGRLFAPSFSGLDGKAGFIHVYDLCSALIKLSGPIHLNEIIEIDDGHDGYTMADIIAAIAGTPNARPTIIPVPRTIRTLIGACSDGWAQMTKKPNMTGISHLRYLSHKDWTVKPSARADIPEWQAKFGLASGMAHTIKWNRENNNL